MELIKKYFPELTPVQQNQFAQLYELYSYWNERINVISRKDIENLYLHHVLHSLAIARLITFKPSAQILDIGTGGGFPGIPLSIMFPEAHFHLVDSIGKKIKVVEEVATALGLKNTTWQNTRAEQLKDKYDFVVSRAVTTLPEFMTWINGKVSKNKRHGIKNGVFYLKGGNLDEELKPFQKIATVFDISDYFKEEFFETKKVVFVPVA